MTDNRIVRWLHELFHPSDKCRRVGHSEIMQKRSTYRKPSRDDRRWYVVMGCEEERKKCVRCGGWLEEWRVIDSTGYNSSSMPSDMAATLRREGVVQR